MNHNLNRTFSAAGVDYTPLTQPLSFNPSQTNLVVCVMVTILEDDRIEEGGETFLMVLTSDSGVVALASRTVQILDNDGKLLYGPHYMHSIF